MRLRNFVSAAIVIAAIVLPMSAHAQYQISDKSRVGVSMAAMHPSGAKLQSLGRYWLGPTLQINVTFDELDRANGVVALTWFGQESASARSNIIPLTYTYIRRFGKDQENPWYVGGGAGAYFVNFKSIEPNAFGGNSYVSDNKIQYGVNLVAGKEMGGWFVEFRKDFVSSMTRSNGASLDLSSWQFSIGTRLAL